MRPDFKALEIAARKTMQRGVSRSWLSWTAGLSMALPMVYGTLKTAHIADDLLFRGWRKTKVREPVFILTGPRSGTTRLHRLLAQDGDKFSYQKLYQSIFPSPTVYSLVKQASDLDEKLLGGRLRTWIHERDAAMVPAFQEVHKVSVSEAEEDETLFLYSLTSPTLMMLFPSIEEFRARGLDHQSRQRQDEVMGFYKDCLKRHLSYDGPDKSILIKNVFTASRMQAMLRTFPDARIINLVRHPYESVASAVSMFSVPWRSNFPDRPTDGPEYKAFAELMMEYQRTYAALEHQLPENQFISVRFDDLISDPKTAVLAIYERFGWPVTNEFKTILEKESVAQRSFKSKHKYSLEKFGLSEEEVYEGMKDIFERHNFQR